MIPLASSTFVNEELTKQALCEFIADAKQLSMGPRVEAFEAAFAAWQGRRYAVCVNSGSSANLALLSALLELYKIQPGEEVAFSNITWSTNVSPIIQLGLQPVPIDVELDTLNVSWRKLRYVRPLFSALFLTNALGLCDDIPAIADYCEKQGILLIEDNCEALGSECQGRKLGNWGLASTFSFFVGHHLSTIEGGMICTDDERLANTLRMVREHGWARRVEPTERARLAGRCGIESWFEPTTFYVSGYNLRPTEITGFLGLNQLQYLDASIAERERNFYSALLSMRHARHIIRPRVDHMSRVSSFAIPLVFDDCDAYLRARERFIDAGVEIRPIIAKAITMQPLWIDRYAVTPTNSKLISEQGFYLPNRADLTRAEVDTLCNLIGEC